MGYQYRYGRSSLVRDFDSRVVSVVTTTDPVTLEEVKSYLGVEGTDDDTLLTGIITQAVNIAEGYLDRDIKAKERELFYPYLAEDINLLWAPIDTSVTVTVSVDGTATTDFELLGFDDPLFRLGGRVGRDVTISYTTAALANADVKQGILALCGHIYPRSDIKLNWKSWLAPYKRLWI